MRATSPILLMLVPPVVVGNQKIILRPSGGASGVFFLLLGRGRFLHAFDKAPWPHVGPMLIYEFEASGTAVRCVNYGPTRRDLDEARPKRMLSFVVDQNMIDAVFVFERISHVVLHHNGRRPGSIGSVRACHRLSAQGGRFAHA